ncbi:MAG TPA: tetratricopeptide repeat protein [Nitrospirae bacterium]|nr:tetratricopeptide repeat protein [Nitrospirota bacterium]
MSSGFNPERVRGAFTGGKDSRPFPFAFPESSLAHKYCIGKGLEIGGSAHNPFGLDTLNLDMTDSMDTVFKKEEINLCGKALKVDIVVSGDDISLLDESQDFIISSHVLEHFSNPIKALIEWDRLIKTGGIIFMIVPHKERTFDKCRNRTPLQHLIEDYYSDNAKPHGDPNGHDHCWVTEDIVVLIDWMIDNLNVKWEIVEVSDVDDKVGNGFTIVIRKKGKRDCVVDLNEGLGSFDLSSNPETLFLLKDACISNLESKLRKKDALISNMGVVIRDYKQELQQIISTEQKTSIVSPAIESLLEMLEKEDISAKLSVKAGEVCFSLGLYDSAISFFNRAMSVDSGNPEALNNLGVLNFQLQDYNAAKDFFIKALALDPDNKEAKINLALLSKTVNCAI